MRCVLAVPEGNKGCVLAVPEGNKGCVLAVFKSHVHKTCLKDN